MNRDSLYYPFLMGKRMFNRRVYFITFIFLAPFFSLFCRDKAKVCRQPVLGYGHHYNTKLTGLT